VDLRAGLDYVENRKFLTLPGLELDPSVVQPVDSRSTDYAIRLLYNLSNLSKVYTVEDHMPPCLWQRIIKMK
jgi:hypothetical protein